jgi:hypothetical protein
MEFGAKQKNPKKRKRNVTTQSYILEFEIRF